MASIGVSNDDLGDWGEAQFRAFCAAGGMVANKAERDKMGWDFLVELPPEAVPSELPLDQQPNALRCRVQVKTQWRREDDRFEMTLSAAQRLAREPGPSFVLVLTAEQEDEEPNLVDCHIIHMLGDNLARVLKRLRQNEADPQAKSLVLQTISYSPKIAGEQVSPRGKAIRDAFLHICGSDAYAYMTEKNEQLKNLGYSSGRYKLNTTITANNMDEFVEMTLGLRPVTVSGLETFDTRFDVLIPVDHVQPGSEHRLEFKLRPQSRCKVSVHGKNLTAPAVFQTEVFFPIIPNIPKEHLRMLIRAQFFTLDLAVSGKVSFTLAGESLFKAALELGEWCHHMQLLRILGTDEVEFCLDGDGPESLHTLLSSKSLPIIPEEPWFASLAEVARQGEVLLAHVGAKGRAITFDDLNASGEMISRAYVSILEPSALQPQTFRTICHPSLDSALPEVDFLQADYANLAGTTLAYSSRVTMRAEPSADGLLWRQVDSKLERFAVIEGTGKAFKAFVDAASTRTGLVNTMIREFTSNGRGASVEQAEGSHLKP